MKHWVQRISATSSRPWVLAFGLLLLHLGLVQGVGTTIGSGLMIGHLGAVLLWQPLVRQDRRVRRTEVLLGFGVLAVLAIWMSWGLSLLWVLVLAGMIGAEAFRQLERQARYAFWAAMAYLIVVLVALVLPQLLPTGEQPPRLLSAFATWGAPWILALIPLLAHGRQDARLPRQQVALDLVGGLLIVLVLSGVLLGALALMFVSEQEYIPALLQSIGIMALCLLLLTWVWSPSQGGGLSLAVARHTLSGSTPFSHWLDEVAQLAASEGSPETLVRDAVRRMLDWHGVEGADWRVTHEGISHSGFAGRVATRRCVLAHGDLEVGIHSRHELAPSYLWQVDLMVRLLAEFYAAREQSRYLQSMSYLRAVYETGARMTHEVKNLLQSIDTLCFALAQAERDGRSEAVQALMSRQLPVISERLHVALDRIRQPLAEDVQLGDAGVWWAAVPERVQVFELPNLQLRTDGDLAGAQIPVLLFDTVLENLLRNVVDKSTRAGQKHSVVVSVMPAHDGCRITVEDDGDALPSERAEKLFVQPLASDGGLGIGLYQASRLAETLGYRLVLDCNERGRVCFSLSPVMRDPA